MSVGAQIREARRGLDYTQYQLARRLEVDPMTVSRWERDITPPSLKTLQTIAELAQLPMAFFFAEDGEKEQVA